MRIMCRRNCIKYVFTMIMMCILVSLYIAALRHNQDIHKRFHFKRLKVKRDLHSPMQRRTANISHVKEPPHADVSQVSSKLKRAKNGPLDVYIVDEHHEVIPPWFSAAGRKAIPKSGNTVVHIDGHADLAPPLYVPGFPFFIYPQEKELKFLMQTNDAFIQGSAIVGLVNRVIWVWPSWDIGDHEVNYVMSTLSLGYFTYTDNKNETQKGFCVCMKNETRTECKTLTSGIVGTDATGDEGFILPRSNCKIKKIIIVEEINENSALHYFKKRDWISEDENLILDIDEDYYGCGYAITPLLKANLSYERIFAIDELIKSNLCPIAFSHEKETDKYLVQLIGAAREKRICSLNQTLKHTQRCQKVLKRNLRWHFTQQLNISVVNRTIHMCSKKRANQFVNILIAKLTTLNEKQLKSLQTVGFCLNTSPRTFPVLRAKSYGLCYGANTPADTAVTEHIPTPAEIGTRSIVLKGLLKRLSSFSVNLVTISRSSRDGYTPRELSGKIEKDILKNLNATMNRTIRLHYDNFLLGGKQGWQARMTSNNEKQ